MRTTEEYRRLEARIAELEQANATHMTIAERRGSLIGEEDEQIAELIRLIATQRVEIARLQTVEIKWIDVLDSLPDADRTVLITTIDDDEPVWIGWLDGDSWRDTLGGKVKVSAWAEFPPPARSA